MNSVTVVGRLLDAHISLFIQAVPVAALCCFTSIIVIIGTVFLVCAQRRGSACLVHVLGQFWSAYPVLGFFNFAVLFLHVWVVV